MLDFLLKNQPEFLKKFREYSQENFVFYKVVEDYIKKLFEENDYPISEHRTKGIVHIGEYNENTTVEIRYFTEPEDGSFNDYDFVIEGWCPLVNNYTV